jgi:hypothetical protein
MADKDTNRADERPSRGPGRAMRTALSDDERAWVEAVAAQEGISFDEALERLVSDGLAERVRQRTMRNAASYVRHFHEPE